MALKPIEIVLNAAVGGLNEIKRLIAGLDDTSEEAKLLKQQAEQLNTAFRDVAKQQQTIDALRQLHSEARTLGQTLNAATAAVDAAATHLQASGASARDFAQAQQTAKQAVDATRAELTQQRQALTELKTSSDAATKGTNEYKAAVAQAEAEIAAMKAALLEKKAALAQANDAAKEASAEEKRLQQAYEGAVAVAAQASRAYGDNRRAMDDAREAAKQLGLDTNKLGDAQKQVQADAQQAAQGLEAFTTAVQQTKTAVAAQAAEQVRAAAAAKEAAAEELRLANMVAETKARMAAQAKAEADGIIADYARMEQAQREAAQAAQKAAQDTANAMQNAFGTAGVRSAEAIRAQIQQVREAMQLLSTSGHLTSKELATAMKSGEKAIAALELELRQATGTMTMTEKAAGLLKNSVGQITAGNLAANGIGYLTSKAQELGNEFVQSVMQGEKMRLALTAIYKDSGTAASQIKFLKDSARQAGIAYGDLSQDFIKFSATMNGANIPLKQSNELFTALTRAAGALGMSSEEVSGALNALGQMASKGVVSMEELRQQLGERLPGAMSLVAKGFGISEKALIDLVSSGQLAFRDLIVPLTGALQTMQAETNGMSNAWDRLKNLMKGTSQDMGDAGWAKILTLAIQMLGTVLGAVVLTLQGFYEGLRSVMVMAMGLSQVLTGDLKNGLGFIYEELGKTRDRLNNTSSAIGSLWGETDKAKASIEGQTAAIQGNNTALNTNATATGAAAIQMGALAQAAVKSTEGVSGLERVAQLQAIAIKLAGDNTLDSSAKIVQFNVAAQAMMTMQEKTSEAATKHAKAVKDEGDALVSLIALRGNEQATLVAAATATANHQVALEKVAASQKAEVDILQLQLQALERDKVQRGLSDEAVKAQKDGLDAKLVTARAEAEQAKASAEAVRQEALARDIAAKSYADNSAKVEEYSRALEQAKTWIKQVDELQRQGLATDEMVKSAKEGLTRAQALYNDALKDSVTKQQAYGEAKKSVYALETAGLNLSLKQAEASERMARLMGKESEAREAARKQREIEIKLIETKVKSLQAEADSMEATALAQQKELEAKGELTEVNQIHISNALRAAEAKREEAKATEAGIAVMKKEADQLGASAEAYIKKAEAIKRKNETAQADSALVKSSLELRKSEIEASIAIAEAKGKETEVVKLKIEQKRIEIAIIQETVKAQIADAESSIGAAEAKMSELRATGSLTAEKRKELENQIKSAQAKINEAKARGESVRVLEQEIKALQGSTSGYNANVSAINQTTAALEALNAEREREIAAKEKSNELNEREAELERKRRGTDKEGYSVDVNGNRIVQTVETQQSLYNKAKDSGLTADQSKRLADQYAPKQGGPMFDNNAFWTELNQLKQQNDLNAERTEAEKMRQEGQAAQQEEQRRKEEDVRKKQEEIKPAPAPPALTPSPAPAPQAWNGNGGSASITPAPTYVSNISLPGLGKATAKFDTAAEQQNMKAMLRAITSAAGVAQ